MMLVLYYMSITMMMVVVVYIYQPTKISIVGGKVIIYEMI